MKIPGYTKVQLSLLMILAISSVSSTALQISARANNISEENISGKKENPKEESVESLLNQTGSDTLEALRSLNETLKIWAERISEEKSSQSTRPSDESTMKRPDSSSSTTCSPSQIDGLPKYYNNNILGRYMRKDYFDADN